MACIVLLDNVEVCFVCRWNHAFKNQITTLQSQAKNRANPNRSEVQANLSLFLEAASGFYTQASLKKEVACLLWWSVLDAQKMPVDTGVTSVVFELTLKNEILTKIV